MKHNKAILYTLSAFLIFSMAPSTLMANTSPVNKPAAKRAPAQTAAQKKLKDLQDQLAAKTKENDAKAAELVARNKELDDLKRDVANLKAVQASNDRIAELAQSIKDQGKQIGDLLKVVQDGKSEIAGLKEEVKKAELAPDVNIVNNNIDNRKIDNRKIDNRSVIVECLAKQQGAKLGEEVKKDLKDLQPVIDKEVTDLKKQNIVLTTETKPDEKKADVKPIEVKKQEVAKVEEKKPEEAKKDDVKVADTKKDEAKSEVKKDQSLVTKYSSDNSEMISLMSQMTSMFSTQMQAQMQMQMQMMSMLSQMQNNMLPQMSPFSYNPSQFSQSHRYLNGYPTLSDSIGWDGMGLGIQAQSSPWSDYQNPYSMMPNMSRQPLYAPADFGFYFNNQTQAAPIKGFDFNQSAPALQPAVPQQSLTKTFI